MTFKVWDGPCQTEENEIVEGGYWVGRRREGSELPDVSVQQSLAQLGNH